MTEITMQIACTKVHVKEVCNAKAAHKNYNEAPRACRVHAAKKNNFLDF